MTRVHVVDDHPVVRQGVALVLADHPHLELTGSSSNAAQALVKVVREQPDVILLDVRLQGSNVVTVVRSLRRASSDSRILLFTADPAHPMIPAALAAGAAAVVSKDVSPTDLRDILVEKSSAASRPPVRLLTPRQQEVLELIAQGLTNAEVADHLGLASETVKDYWQQVRQRLGARNRAEAITVAHQRGLL